MGTPLLLFSFNFEETGSHCCFDHKETSAAVALLWSKLSGRDACREIKLQGVFSSFFFLNVIIIMDLSLQTSDPVYLGPCRLHHSWAELRGTCRLDKPGERASMVPAPRSRIWYLARLICYTTFAVL